MTTQRSTLIITGMSCGSCRQHATKALQGVPGVTHVQVDLASGRAEVEHASTVTPDALLQSIVAAGYGARVAGAPA
jgi:copper chaperone CopZ